MDWTEIRDKIEKEAKAIQFNPPDEVVRLFKHQIIPSGQGNYGQAFTTMVFAAGDARALAYYNVMCILRLCEEPSLTLDQLKILFKEFVPLSAHFLSTCGMEKVHELIQDMLKTFDTLEKKDDFYQLIDSLSLYVSILSGWVHHYFPWHIGELYPQRKAEDVKEMVNLMNI